MSVWTTAFQVTNMRCPKQACRGTLSMRSLLKVFGFALPFLFFSRLVMAQAPVPDMILIGGKIITVDARDTVAEALAISQGRISAVGSAVEIRALAGPQTVMVDLAGRTVIPGLI